MSYLRNARLRAAREATPSTLVPGQCLSRTELADRINQYVWFNCAVRTTVDRKYIARLEAGQVCWPNERYRQALRQVLDVANDTDLGFVPTRLARATSPLTGLDLPWTIAGAVDSVTAVTEDEQMNRRDFLHGGSVALSGGTLAQLAWQWMVALPVVDAGRSSGPTISHAQVDAFDLAAAELRHMDDQVGSGSVLALAQGQLHAVANLLRSGRYRDAVGRRLHASAAELLRLCGWLSWDAGRQAHAQRYWGSALRCAHVAGDNQIGANIMAFWACQLLEDGDPQTALNFASAARQKLSGSPKVTAIVNLCLAEAAGGMGEGHACHSAIDAAYNALSEPVDGQPEWAYWVDDNFDEMAGYALHLVGDQDQAVEHLTAYVNGPTPAREQARGRAFLARTYVAVGEPTEAIRVGIGAIDLMQDTVISPRSVQQLHKIDVTDADPGEADEFTQRLAAL